MRTLRRFQLTVDASVVSLFSLSLSAISSHAILEVLAVKERSDIGKDILACLETVYENHRICVGNIQ